MRPILFITLAGTLYGVNAAADPPEPDAEVYFQFDSSWIDDHSAQKLEDLAEVIGGSSATKIVLDAHADEAGTGPYNVALSIRRAVAVRKFLTARGFDEARIVIAAYGEDAPRRASRALDRRVSLTVTAEPMYSIIDGSGNATAVVWNEPLTLAEIEGPDGKIERTARR